MAGEENIRALKEQLDLVKKLIKAEGDLAKKQELIAKASSLEKVIKNLNKYDESLEDAARSQQDLIDGANSLGQAVFNLPLGNYLKFSEITEDISKKILPIQENMEKVAREINQDFAKLKIAIPKPSDKEFKSVINSLNKQTAGMGTDLQEALTSGDIASFFKKYGDEGRKAAKEAMDKKGYLGALNNYFGKSGQGIKDLKTFQDGIRQIEAEAQTFQKVTLNVGALWRGIKSNILDNFGFKRILDQLNVFDKNLADIKREFQIPKSNFAGASEAMADLTIQGAKFGLSTQESFEMVKTIGDEMKSTNVKNLAAIAQSVAAVPAAMGIASGEVSKITGQMMFFSTNADKVQNAFKNISKQSAVFGQNATKVSKQFGEAYPKFKMMGMKGNEAAIAAMAGQAEKLGINLASSVQSSKNFLDIGEAMESAADLSLLGGAAAQVSYADLMQARLDPKKMVQIQDQITAGLGKFNKATGEVDFGYSDLVQMQEMAKRLGVDYEVLYKRAKGQREDANKASMFDKGMFGNLSEEEKQFLLAKVVSKGGGKFELEGLEGVTDLKKVSQGQIKAMMNEATNDKKKMEDLAKERASFQETVDRMKTTIMALFNRFQPVLQFLTNILIKVIDFAQMLSNTITKIFGPNVGKYIKASLALGAILMLTMGPSAMGKLGGLFGKLNPLNWGKAIKSSFGAFTTAFKGGGAATKGVSEITGSAGKIKDVTSVAGGGGSFLSRLGSPTQILATAAAIVALGLAFLMIGKGIKLAAEGMATFVNAFKGMKPAELAAAKGALLGLGIGIVAIMGILAALAFSGVGLVAAGVMLAFGAAVMFIGLGVNLAAKGLAVLAVAIAGVGKNAMSLIKGSIGLIALGAALLIISPALFVFGAASLIAVPGMLALGFLLKALGSAKGVNPGLLKNIASSMGTMAWGLFKLALAAPVAPLAMIAALSMNAIIIALSTVTKFNPKNAINFGSNLSLIAASVIKGMYVLALVGIVSIPAVLGALAINMISKLLNGVKEVDSKKLTAFGESLGKIGLKVGIGLLKLGVVAILALPALAGAIALNKISKNLAEIQPVKEKNIQSFGSSLGLIGLKVAFGLLKLGAIGVLVIPALFGATALNSISKMLNGISAVPPGNIASFAASLGLIGLKLGFGLLKLSAVAVVALPALAGAIALNSISKNLNGVKPVDPKNMALFGESIGKVSGKVIFGLLKLSLIAGPALIASIAANRLAAISKSLNSINPINPIKMISLGQAMSQIGLKIMWGLTKLAMIAIPSIYASIAASRLSIISRLLNSITPINPTKLALFGQAVGSIGGKVIFGIMKLGMLVGPLALATLASKMIVGISRNLGMTKEPTGLMNISRSFFMLGAAMRYVSMGFSSSAKAMAEFNAQFEKVKLNTGKGEIVAKLNTAKTIAEKAPAAGAGKTPVVVGPGTASKTENIKIAPIEINLKLNGMQIQKLITEANFYRT